MLITHNSLVELTLIFDVFEKSIRSLCIGEYSNEQIEAWVLSRADILKWEQKRKKQQFWFAWDDQTLMGFCSFDENKTLDLLYVNPQFKNQKVAYNLVKTVCEYALENHVSIIYTEASLTAVPFFQKFGFISKEVNSFVYHGVAMKNVSMQLQL